MRSKHLISYAAGVAMLFSSVSFLSGCSTLQEFFTGEKFEEPIQAAMTNRDWLNMVNEAYGTNSSEDELVDDAKEWGIIGENEEIDLDAPVNDEFVTSTLARAAGYADTDSSYEEIKLAMEEHGVDNVEYLTDPSNAQNVLEKIQEDMIHPHFEERRNIQLADNVCNFIGKLRSEDIKVKEDTVTIPFNNSEELNKDSVFILPGDKYGDEAAYKVIAVIDNGDDTANIKCVPASLCEVYKSVDVSGHFPVDLNDFEAADSENVTLLKNGVTGGSFSGYSREKLLSDKNDSINFSTKLQDGCVVNVSVKDIVLNAKLDWSVNDNGDLDIKRIFLSADYISDVSIEKRKDGENEKIEPDGTNTAVSAISMVPMEIGRVPVHICSGLTFYLDLSFVANSEGELSVNVKTGETNGFEMRGAKFRTINSVLDLANIRAEMHSWEYTNINIAVNMDYLLNDEKFISLDITSGPDVRGEATLHNASDENSEKLLCLDVNGFIKAQMNLYFSDAVSSETGFGHFLKLLELDEGRSRVKWENIHYENGEKVAECTYKKKNEKEDNSESTTLARGTFSIDTTYLSICEGEIAAISLKQLPSGYTKDDVVWTSLDPSVVTVDSNGNVTAVSRGATGISAATKDGAYTASCAVIVKGR